MRGYITVGWNLLVLVKTYKYSVCDVKLHSSHIGKTFAMVLVNLGSNLSHGARTEDIDAAYDYKERM